MRGVLKHFSKPPVVGRTRYLFGQRVVERLGVGKAIQMGFKIPPICFLQHRLMFPAKMENQSTDSLPKAADNGDVEAQYQLALFYSEGKVIAQDLKEAELWLRKAAENDHIHRSSISTGCSLFWYKKAAEQGHVQAQRILGGRYAEGRGEDQQDMKEAVHVLVRESSLSRRS
jgi:TPR repeat protein